VRVGWSRIAPKAAASVCGGSVAPWIGSWHEWEIGSNTGMDYLADGWLAGSGCLRGACAWRVCAGMVSLRLA